MPVYVYGCKEHPEIRVEVVHAIQDVINLPCPTCKKPMHRIPQAFRWYRNPSQLLVQKLEERFVEYRKEKKYGIQRKHKRGTPIAN